ncbi:ThiF family adenylyltransferase [Streptococcus gallolyticus]|uniref:Molybdopterin or thiamine biosynthesis adenylyltransferase n=1 Tax=Streptococcus gallolyticus TaxID=315405 RepID=A0A1H9PDU3_9STRE|nr:ThiF family adenylyltransferase [Streptococcus gallolyticus]SER45979.1 Molybdopterin or thiamine biosynthesis adenylyltransferase [Streptococcus gallolyticus]
MKYKTSLTATTLKSNENLIGIGSKQYTVSDDEFNLSLKILEFLLTEKDEDEILNWLDSNNIDKSVFKKLVANKLITTSEVVFQKEDTMEFKNGLYLDLIINNVQDVLTKFKETTFVIIGCGGIGNFMSYALSVYSPKKLVLIDGDKIEKSNLNRQFLFTINDIGKYKSEVIADALKLRNPNLDIEIYTEFINTNNINNILEGKDTNSMFGILSGDDDTAVSISSKYFLTNNVPFVNIGYLNDIAVIGPFVIPHKTSCPFCYGTFSINGEINSNDETMAQLHKQYASPSSIINNSLACDLALSDIIQYFAGNIDSIKSLNARVGINSNSFEKYVLPNTKDPNCSICGGTLDD